MKDYVIVDNFLKEEELNELESVVYSDVFPWYCQKTINENHDKNDNTLYFTHKVFDGVSNSSFINLINKFFWKKLDIKSLIRIKINCYPSSFKLRIHEKHIDYKFKHKGALFSINSCNGFTTLKDNTKIESIKNRLLFFDPSKPHSSSNCTDKKARFNINFNYF